MRVLDVSLVCHLSAGCLRRSGLQSRTRDALARDAFSRREVESNGDVRSVFRQVCASSIDRTAIEESPVLVRRRLMRLAQKLSKSFLLNSWRRIAAA